MAKQNPFDFASQTANSVGDTFSSLKSQWDSFLEAPGARTALLQFGINMMQPAWDAGTMGQVGRAIGSAGEAVTAQNVLEQREREGEARIERAQAQAEKALMGQQMQKQGQQYREDVARGELQRKIERDEDIRRNRGLQGEFVILREYNKYRMGVDKRNAAKEADILNPNRPPEIPMSLPDFRRTYGPAIGGGVPIDPTEEGESRLPPSATPASPTLSGRGVPSGAMIDPSTRPRATNPKTGEVVEFDGRSWVPVGPAKVGPRSSRETEDPMGAD